MKRKMRMKLIWHLRIRSKRCLTVRSWCFQGPIPSQSSPHLSLADDTKVKGKGKGQKRKIEDDPAAREREAAEKAEEEKRKKRKPTKFPAEGECATFTFPRFVLLTGYNQPNRHSHRDDGPRSRDWDGGTETNPESTSTVCC